MGKRERESSMKNCYPIQSGNHFMHRAFLLILSLFVAIFFCSFGIQAYELNGTATGNILNNGCAAEADGISVYADIDNGYALTLEQNGKTIVIDEDNAQYIHLCGEKIYYTSVDGAAGVTSLRCYDLAAGKVQILYSVAIGEGMKNLMVLDDQAMFISNGAVMSYDLTSGNVKTILTGGIREFVMMETGIVYTVNGKADLYFQNANGEVVTLGSDVVAFDCSRDAVFFSNGEDGIYKAALNGGDAARVADGGMNLVYSDDLYWLADGKVQSLNGGTEAVVANDDTAAVAVLGTEVLVEENAILTMDNLPALADSDATVGLSAVSVSALPDGEYKNWKQGDERWGGNTLGNATISRIGCAATAIAILLVGSGAEKDRYLKGTFDPGVFVQEMTANGGFTAGGGMYWYKISTVYSKFGASLRDTGKGTSSDFYNLDRYGQSMAIKNHLAAGKFVIICVDNTKTGNTHWLAVDYATNDGIYVCDPGYNSVASPTNVYEISWYSKVTRAIIFSYSGDRWVEGGNPVEPEPAPPEIQWDNPFKDVNKSFWYYDNVGEVYEAGWMVGRSTNQFAPDANMTRKEFVVLASRLADTDFTAYDEVPFIDVAYDASDAWFSKYLPWAVENGVMVGYQNPDGTMSFRPDDCITREQICAVLVRLSSRVTADMSVVEPAVTFEDAKKISSWAKADLNTAQRTGLIYGSLEGGKLYMNPQDFATRAEVAAIFLRFTRKIPII